MQQKILITIFSILLLLVFVSAQESISTAKPLSKESREAANKAIDKGIRYLRGQLVNGCLLGDPGITSLGLLAFMKSPRQYGPADGPWIRDGLAFLISLQKENGGIYKDQLACYNTSIALLALTAHPDVAKKYATNIEKAKQFLVRLQCDEGENYTPEEDIFYGGFGYGSSERPDLSNTQFALEALRAAGLPDDDPAYQKAVVFLQRCQNRSESNSLEWASNDGGFVYYPGNSAAGTVELPNGKIGYRSYGSMTYAGIKSYIYANMKQDDPRFQAALDWIKKNYDLSQNPGIGLQGLFYYYHTFAKTLALLQFDTLTDNQGVAHNWREDLIQTLVSRQNSDGSWKNTHPRWWETQPQLVTTYSILCLSLCLEENK